VKQSKAMQRPLKGDIACGAALRTICLLQAKYAIDLASGKLRMKSGDAWLERPMRRAARPNCSKRQATSKRI
jgi:hypothetical protein